MSERVCPGCGAPPVDQTPLVDEHGKLSLTCSKCGTVWTLEKVLLTD